MKIKLTFILFGFLLSIGKNYAQLDSIQKLETVILTDVMLSNFSEGYKKQTIKDTVLQNNSYSITDLIRFSSPLYFKENGYGMISSVSFRGTNASQTAVIWNGIPINSVLTGQTEFNTLVPQAYDDVQIRFGGGSVQFGSGAIGGSIHLSNSITFKNTKQHMIAMSYGSYDAIQSSFKTKYASQNKYIDVGASFIHSDNDFKILKTGNKNENGAFLRFSSFLNTAIKFKKQTLSFYSNYYYGDKNLAASLTSISKDKYKDVNTRALLQHTFTAEKWKATTRLAHLYEQYAYFPDAESSLHFTGKAHTYLGSFNFNYKFSKKINLSAFTEINHVNAGGTNFSKANRNTIASVLLWKHKLSNKLTYGVNLRKEFLNTFKNPLLIAFDVNYKLNKKLSLLCNASKNYRVPTFNDLYWQQGGNPNLQPETSYQGEIGSRLRLKNFQMGLNLYLIKSKNLIKWVPQDNGIWQPVNISKTKNFGGELSFNYAKKFRNSQTLDVGLQYSYTKATDLEKNTQLIYVPKHKITSNLAYTYKKTRVLVQVLKNSKVFTTTDNKQTLSGYWLLNMQFYYSILKKHILGFRINNILNTYYENVAYRPMPNRNVQLFLNLTI